MIRRLLTHNTSLKLASLGLAIFLWAVVRAEPADRQEISSVPVLVQVADLDWTLAADPEPASVRVRFAGPVREVLRLDREGTSVRVPIDEITSADTVIQLRRDWVVLGGATGLVVEDVEPAEIRLRLARNVTEPRRVVARLQGRLPAGLALAAVPSIDPGTVQLRGSAERLSAIDSVLTVPLDLAEVREAGTFVVEVDTFGLGSLSVSPREVTLGLQLDTLEERFLPSVEVGVAGADDVSGWQVLPETLGVSLSGARSILLGADFENLRAEVDVSELGDVEPGEERRLPVRLLGLPPLIQAVPVVTQVTVRWAPDRP